jgi:phosphoribosylaminoimidazole carboxylase
MVNEIAPRPHNSGHYTIEACPISQYEAHLRAILDLPLPENCTELTTPAIMLNILGGESPTSHLEICKKALQIAGAHVHLYGKQEARKGRKMGHITFTGSSMAACEDLLDQCMGTKAADFKRSEVAVIMGSDSDLPVMAAGCQMLEDFGIQSDVTIVSAHRTPERMVEFAKTASSRGVKVIIAGAGGLELSLDCTNTTGAAHLPGMVAALTPLPVIGVPVKASRLGWNGFTFVDRSNASIPPYPFNNDLSVHPSRNGSY